MLGVGGDAEALRHQDTTNTINITKGERLGLVVDQHRWRTGRGAGCTTRGAADVLDLEVLREIGEGGEGYINIGDRDATIGPDRHMGELGGGVVAADEDWRGALREVILAGHQPDPRERPEEIELGSRDIDIPRPGPARPLIYREVGFVIAVECPKYTIPGERVDHPPRRPAGRSLGRRVRPSRAVGSVQQIGAGRAEDADAGGRA